MNSTICRKIEKKIHANIDIECLYLSLYHCNALVYENKESWNLTNLIKIRSQLLLLSFYRLFCSCFHMATTKQSIENSHLISIFEHYLSFSYGPISMVTKLDINHTVIIHIIIQFLFTQVGSIFPHRILYKTISRLQWWNQLMYR